MAGPKRCIHEALQWLEEHSVESRASINPLARPRRFIPNQAVHQHFVASRLRPILRELNPDGDDGEIGQLAQDIANPNQSYVVIFLILLQMKQGSDISIILEDAAIRPDLPFPDQKVTGWPDGIDYDEFLEKQLPFCAPTFFARMSKKIPDNWILPIEEQCELAKGDSATVFRIRLHQEYDKLTSAPNFANEHFYVLKSFHGPDAEKFFNAEIAGYRKTRAMGQTIDSLTEFYGSYRYQNQLNVVLEYADGGTWEDFMKKEKPPRAERDVRSMWRKLFSLNEALQRVHLANGWHQDICPGNVLVKSRDSSLPYGYTLKLADFGRSHFQAGTAAATRLLARDTFGTKDYGAPECYRRDGFERTSQIHVSQTVDVWSLGCLWSEAAVWMIYGWSGVQRYRENRKKEVSAHEMEDIACFHDGAQKLACVDRWHQSCISPAADPNDHVFITSQVCSRLLDHMLHASHEYRITSKDLGKQIIELNRARSVTAPDPNISTFEGEGYPMKPWSSLDDTHGNLRSLVETPRTMTLVDSSSPTQQFDITRPRVSSPEMKSPSSLLANDTKERDLESHSPVTEQAGGQPPEGSVHNSRSDSPHRTSHPQWPSRVHGSHRGGTPRNRRTTEGVHPGPSSPRNSTSTTAGPPRATGTNTYDSHRSSSSTLRLPELSVVAAMNFMLEKKKGNQNAFLPYGTQLKGKLKARDHLFILDDSYSTAPFWEDICGLLRILAFLVEEDDPDGVEILFANAKNTLRSKNSEELVALANRIQPRGSTNMESVFESVITDYDYKIRRSSQAWSKARPLSIYVLTDGVFHGGGNPEVTLLAIENTLTTHNLDRDQIGIQFIKFGDDKDASARLELFDEMQANMDLHLDIVDTVQSNGNVWKMLLGAIDPIFDAQQ